MKITLAGIFLMLMLSQTFGRDRQEPGDILFPRHFISVNPLNMLAFQQAGISYEFKPGRMGYGLTTSYIYPNHLDYSNYFIAGPTDKGSLGDYSGFFVLPQVNLYFNNPKNSDHANLFFFMLKPVYKFMQIDSTEQTAWSHPDDYYIYRKMNDNVNIYGGFVGFGYKWHIHHFFVNIELGLGILAVNHKMTISGEWISYTQEY